MNSKILIPISTAIIGLTVLATSGYILQRHSHTNTPDSSQTAIVYSPSDVERNKQYYIQTVLPDMFKEYFKAILMCRHYDVIRAAKRQGGDKKVIDMLTAQCDSVDEFKKILKLKSHEDTRAFLDDELLQYITEDIYSLDVQTLDGIGVDCFAYYGDFHYGNYSKRFNYFIGNDSAVWFHRLIAIFEQTNLIKQAFTHPDSKLYSRLNTINLTDLLNFLKNYTNKINEILGTIDYKIEPIDRLDEIEDEEEEIDYTARLNKVYRHYDKDDEEGEGEGEDEEEEEEEEE